MLLSFCKLINNLLLLLNLNLHIVIICLQQRFLFDSICGKLALVLELFLQLLDLPLQAGVIVLHLCQMVSYLDQIFALSAIFRGHISNGGMELLWRGRSQKLCGRSLRLDSGLKVFLGVPHLREIQFKLRMYRRESILERHLRSLVFLCLEVHGLVEGERTGLLWFLKFWS